jgi:hypothetical protein
MNWDWKKWASEFNFEGTFKGLFNTAVDWFLNVTYIGPILNLAKKAPSTVLSGDSARQADDFFKKMDALRENGISEAAAEAAKIAKAKVAELNPTRLAGGESATAPAPQTPPMVPKPAASTERAPAA